MASPRSKPEKNAAAQGQALRALRHQLGLSREELAKQIKINPKTIARWERGECKVPHLAVVYLESETAKRATVLRNSDFTFIDLFAGIGGMRTGFECAGGRCVFTSEWNEYSQKSYAANFPAETIHGDITKIEPQEVPAHDVLLAGFPCQPFSIAGVSKKNALGRPHGGAVEAGEADGVAAPGEAEQIGQDLRWAQRVGHPVIGKKEDVHWGAGQ